MIIVPVPTINDRPSDFDQLFALWRRVLGDGLPVHFDFASCRFLRPNAVAFLGGLARLIAYQGGQVSFAWETLREEIRMNLAQNGFLWAFGLRTEPWLGNSIPYREDIVREKESLTAYLKTMWLGRDWVHLNMPLQNAIAGQVWEIYENAFTHSLSPIGVFSCGQHYPNLCRLKLTVVDFGVGIPSNVRVFKRNPYISAESALRWAFMPGTTTQPGGLGRGMGLDLLKEFVRLNRGQIEIYSHDGYALIDGESETYLRRRSYFEGTIVNITLSCDEQFYHLVEAPSGPLF